MALLSDDDPSWWLLGNDQIVAARDMINDFAGTTRMTLSYNSRARWLDG